MYKVSLLVICIQFIQAFVYGDDGRERRGLSMLRMGKRDMGYLRMGRSYSLPPLVPPSYDLPEDDIEERELNVADFDLPRLQYTRVPPFPRLGYEEYINEIRRELGDEPRQIYVKTPRIGRYLGRQKRSADALADEHTEALEGEPEVAENEEHHQSKRALPRFGVRDIPLPRLGMYERATPFPRLGLYERSFPRLGVREEDEDERSIPIPPRLGLRELDNELDERALPRIGVRDLDQEEEKRAMGMLRMGKRDPEYADKRAMGMLRMGRSMGMLRMGKRAGMSMLRMGRSMEDSSDKRAMGMLRMGRSDNSLSDDTDNMEKRAMGMLRMGRAMPLGMRASRGMSMLRMGRSDPSMSESALQEEKRGGPLSINSRGMSMLRMGKRSAEEQEENDTQQKRDMGMLRMGKKDNES